MIISGGAKVVLLVTVVNVYQMNPKFCAGRYVILLLSIFSIYTGLLYNEFFSIPLSLFGNSQWACASDPNLQDRAEMELNHTLCPSAFADGLARTSTTPYPIGLDPTWHGTRTELTYLNSIKMKMSIILGTSSSVYLTVLILYWPELPQSGPIQLNLKFDCASNVYTHILTRLINLLLSATDWECTKLHLLRNYYI